MKSVTAGFFQLFSETVEAFGLGGQVTTLHLLPDISEGLLEFSNFHKVSVLN